MSGVLVGRHGVEVAAEAAGSVGVVFGQGQSDVGCVINGHSEAKLLTPEFIKAKLQARKHRVGCIGQRESTQGNISTH